uniref:Uncharacterized protein n=1 Tax=Anguilla anguilla TaxID=7936 RepID=A0A0E9W9W1_ANGAN
MTTERYRAIGQSHPPNNSSQEESQNKSLLFKQEWTALSSQPEFRNKRAYINSFQ